MANGYDIVHEPNFDKELSELKGSLEQGDEFVKGVMWVINRDPYRGRRSNENVWEFEMSNTPVRIYYTINEETREVCLLGIKKFDKNSNA